MEETKIIQQVAYCPHCGNRAPQRLVYKRKFFSYGYDMEGNKMDDDLPAAYFVAECETCYEILVYLAEIEIPEDKFFSEADLIWPDPGRLPRGVPKLIYEIYQEAARIKNLAPNAFAVQIRRALEALCDERRTKKGSLADRLNDLAIKGEIPPVLAEMSEVLRLLGNIGAHASEHTVKPGHVRAIDEFFKAIVEYVYVAPEKIKSLKESLSKLKSV